MLRTRALCFAPTFPGTVVSAPPQCRVGDQAPLGGQNLGVGVAGGGVGVADQRQEDVDHLAGPAERAGWIVGVVIIDHRGQFPDQVGAAQLMGRSVSVS